MLWLTYSIEVYFNSLLATLNARDKLREGFFGDSQQSGGTYQMSRVSANHVTSFGTTVAVPGSPTLASFGYREKVCMSVLPLNVSGLFDFAQSSPRTATHSL